MTSDVVGVVGNTGRAPMAVRVEIPFKDEPTARCLHPPRRSRPLEMLYITGQASRERLERVEKPEREGMVQKCFRTPRN